MKKKVGVLIALNLVVVVMTIFGFSLIMGLMAASWLAFAEVVAAAVVAAVKNKKPADNWEQQGIAATGVAVTVLIFNLMITITSVVPSLIVAALLGALVMCIIMFIVHGVDEPGGGQRATQ